MENNSLNKKNKLIDYLSENKSNYIDETFSLILQNKTLKFSCILLATSSIFLLISLSILIYKDLSYQDKTNILLAPTKQKGWVDVLPNRISNDYASGVFGHIAMSMSNWTFDFYEDQFTNISNYFFSEKLKEVQLQILNKNGFINQIKSLKMSSIFIINNEKSKVQYCNALKATCGYIVGIEKLYKDGQPFSKNEVAYFMIAGIKLSEGVKEKPYALELRRLLRTDINSAETYLKSAIDGKLPDINSAISSIQ